MSRKFSDIFDFMLLTLVRVKNHFYKIILKANYGGKNTLALLGVSVSGQFSKMLSKFWDLNNWLLEKSTDNSLPVWSTVIFVSLFVLYVAVLTYVLVFCCFFLLYSCSLCFKKIKNFIKWGKKNLEEIEKNALKIKQRFLVVVTMNIRVQKNNFKAKAIVGLTAISSALVCGIIYLMKTHEKVELESEWQLVVMIMILTLAIVGCSLSLMLAFSNGKLKYVEKKWKFLIEWIKKFTK